MMKHIALSLCSSAILSPETILDGLIFPVWNVAFRPHGTLTRPQALARTLPLSRSILLCEPLESMEDKDVDVVLRLETCRARATRPSNIPTIFRGIHALAILERDEALDVTIREDVRDLRQRILQDPFMRSNLFSRTILLQGVFDAISAEQPGKRDILVSNLKECLTSEWVPDSVTGE